jgi:ubiquinone/menaquinone biosynthesis C-methylase UbiE
MANALEQGTYIYDVGNHDAIRLQLLNNIYNPFSKAELLKLNINSKNSVVDIPCGQGQMTCWMAQQVNTNVMVTGIDSSEEQLEIARNQAKKLGIKNIQFINMSILSSNLSALNSKIANGVDLIYCRWLLIHLKNAEIKTAVDNLYNLLNIGGVVAHEEVTLKESFMSNSAPSFYKYVELFDKLAKNLDIDFNLGSNLVAILKNSHYNQIKSQIIKPSYTQDQLNFFQLDLESAIASFEKFNLATANEINELLMAMNQEFASGFNATMVNYFVSGIK